MRDFTLVGSLLILFLSCKGKTEYEVYEELKTQPEARKFCQDKGGDLASITDCETFSRLKTQIPSTGPEPSMWIGAMKKGNDVTWLDGSPSNFKFWAPGSPSGDGPCVEMWEHGWNDIGCTVRKSPFVCSFNDKF